MASKDLPPLPPAASSSTDLNANDDQLAVPKLGGPGAPAADFRIDGPQQHGCPGVVQLFGIESPGLTACLAIGQAVAAIVAP